MYHVKAALRAQTPFGGYADAVAEIKHHLTAVESRNGDGLRSAATEAVSFDQWVIRIDQYSEVFDVEVRMLVRFDPALPCFKVCPFWSTLRL